MIKKKSKQFGTFTTNGIEYYRTRIKDQDGKRITLYAKTVDELSEKIAEVKEQIENKTFCRTTPTVLLLICLTVSSPQEKIR
ncbi:MAG: hypothetical protein ACI4DP_02000 [Candidatus Ornithomonoglobus sp.]